MLDSKWIEALFALLINTGSSYVINDVQQVFNDFFSNKVIKLIVIFSICFASTQDIFVSLCISIGFVLIVYVLLDGNCDVCLPKLRKILRKKLLNIDESSKEDFKSMNLNVSK
tara:strand:+ start:159 stop:497 length:339 start_codon:yes stop_codon:yes gene_type:complete